MAVDPVAILSARTALAEATHVMSFLEAVSFRMCRPIRLAPICTQRPLWIRVARAVRAAYLMRRSRTAIRVECLLRNAMHIATLYETRVLQLVSTPLTPLAAHMLVVLKDWATLKHLDARAALRRALSEYERATCANERAWSRSLSCIQATPTNERITWARAKWIQALLGLTIPRVRIRLDAARDALVHRRRASADAKITLDTIEACLF